MTQPTQTETQAIISLSLMAAFADGDKHDRERAEVRRIADTLAQSEPVHLPTLVQDVLMKRMDLASAAFSSPLSGRKTTSARFSALMACTVIRSGSPAPMPTIRSLRIPASRFRAGGYRPLGRIAC